MAFDEPANGTAYRLAAAERRLDRIEALEPAVMRQEISNVKDDIRDIRNDFRSFVDEIAGQRKILLSFIVSFAVAAATLFATRF